VPVSQELLDVVDENDCVIAIKTRGEIHAKGLMHRAVHILLFNSQGELFLQKRSISKDEQPGREIAEELGIVAEQPMEMLFKLPASVLTGNEHCMVYRYVFDGPMVLQAEEIDDGQWLPPAAMDRRVADNDPDLTEAVSLIWIEYRKQHHQSG